MSRDTSAERKPGNVVYLADVRVRLDHSDEPSDPPPGAAAARPCELSFLDAVGEKARLARRYGQALLHPRRRSCQPPNGMASAIPRMTAFGK